MEPAILGDGERSNPGGIQEEIASDLLQFGFLHWAEGWAGWLYKPFPTQLFCDSRIATWSP